MSRGVATINRLLKIVRLFGEYRSLLQGFFAKETYNFKEPTNCSHPIICCKMCAHIVRRVPTRHCAQNVRI